MTIDDSLESLGSRQEEEFSRKECFCTGKHRIHTWFNIKTGFKRCYIYAFLQDMDREESVRKDPGKDVFNPQILGQTIRVWVQWHQSIKAYVKLRILNTNRTYTCIHNIIIYMYIHAYNNLNMMPIAEVTLTPTR